ncbi:MAG: type II toxin-antitoxin system death-on-curing family toxin [Acidobacteriota bacterium]|nr:type II toxin-antitoxin system death-on-curing family toxin [Acidobacteriota bacterium]
METERVEYISYAEAALVHIELMRYLGETRYGVSDRTLVESALARAPQAAAYEQADIQRQAATMLYGLVKNHPWVGGNKRTATTLAELFLNRNGFEVMASISELIELVLAVEADRWLIDEIDAWMRRHSERISG